MAEIEVEDSDLSAIISGEITNSQSYDQSELSKKRATALNYIRGDMPDLPARPNGSTQTSRDVSDTMSWILPGVVRVFTASDQMVRYEATQPAGEQSAEEASEYTNYSFFRENDGYRVLYNATYDSLAMGNGVASSYWEPPKIKTEILRSQSIEQLVMLQDEGSKILSQKETGETAPLTIPDPATGQPVEIEAPLYDVKVERVAARGKICDTTCKPENLLLNDTATTIDDARFVGYLHDDKTRSDLMEMADYYGWDQDEIEQIAADSSINDDSEVQDARTRDLLLNYSSPLRSMDRIDLYECYIKADKDGDGIAELLQVWYAGTTNGGTVLGWEEWEDDIPFTDIPCYPVPHRWDAESVFDRTADIQRVKTVLLRQGLENTYWVNLPMQEVEEGSVLNPDILINPRFGGKIWKKRGTPQIVQQVIPYTADKAFAAMGYMDEMISKRTGVSRTTMALDPETLQNQTATANQNQHDAGYSQIELIARNMAELGWSKYFAKRRNLAKRHLTDAFQIPSKAGDVDPQTGEPSKWRTITPERWGDDMAVTIDTGLGTGSRDRDMIMLQGVLQNQLMMADRFMASGAIEDAIDLLPKIINTMKRIAASAGLRNPEDYYPDYTEEKVAKLKETASQPTPPPIELQIEQMKGDNSKALKAVDAQVATQQAEEKAKGEIVKNQAELSADLQTKDADRQNALLIEDKKQQIEREKIASNERIKAAELAQQRELALLQMDHAEVEVDDGAGGKKKTVKAKTDVNTDRLAEMVMQQGQLLASIAQSLNAPTEIVRGNDGRAIGTRKVTN